jgi:hypothetical protein
MENVEVSHELSALAVGFAAACFDHRLDFTISRPGVPTPTGLL